MKNLKLLCRDEFAIPGNSSSFAFDSETLRIYFAQKHGVKGYESGVEVFSVDLSSQDPPLEGDIVDIEFLCGEEQLCVVMRKGEILLVNVVTTEVEFVGVLDCDVILMKWSPDQEILLMVCSRGNVVVMNREFQPITELEISVESFGEGTFVDVGWGKKETQFQGSAGKYEPPKGQGADEGCHDLGGVNVVWRGDGQYFAVSSFEDKQRKFRVWNRDFELQFTSEELPGLESTLAWQPSGSLLAATQRKPHRYDVVFFELNGLQHGEFTLPLVGGEVRKLEWNSDSRVLLVAADVGEESRLQLWTCSNHRWALKHELCFDESCLTASWDREDPYLLHVLRGGGYDSFRFSTGIDASHNSTVAVIDGKKLKMTPFDHMVVPPPMCAYDLEFKGQVHCVAFPGFPTNNEQVCVLLNSGQLIILSDDGDDSNDDVKVNLDAAGGNRFKVKTKMLKFKFSCQLKDLHLQTLRNLIWADHNQFIVVDSLAKQDRISLLELKSSQQLELINSVEIEDKVVGVCCKPCELRVIVQLRNGNILQSDFDSVCNYLDFNHTLVKLPSIAPQMVVCEFNNAPLLLTLTEQRQLRFGNAVLSFQCSSFAVHDEFLVMTTTNHKLLFIPRNYDITKSINHEITFDLSRSLERGSTIVTVTPGGTKVVLQMPRGNLELVHPRPLVLSHVRRALSGSEYKHAFSLMRKHRINLNLVYDHDPVKFTAEVATFVHQLNSVSFINIFLCDIIDEDVTMTMYEKYYSGRSEVKRSLFSEERSKVDEVCSVLLQQLLKEDRSLFLLSILTAHVRKSKPEIEKALKHIQKVKGSLKTEGLNHLHVLVDGRVLYNEALATYDLELALMVAQASNNDPKEYLPFLTQLKDLEEDFRRYKIDIHLKKYARALVNVSRCSGHFSELVSLVKEHNLHREAMTLFEAGSPNYKAVSSLYGEYLAGSHRYEEAGVVFYRCGHHRRALKCFTASCNYDLALNCARELNYSSDEVAMLAQSLATNLTSKGRVGEAACLLEREANDYKGAVTLLIQGHHWEQAFRLIKAHNLPDLIDSCLLPAMEERRRELTSCIESYSSKFDHHYGRLLVVREAKQAHTLVEGGDLDSDIASDFGSTYTGGSCSSASTGGSMGSGRTAKSRKKRERKRFSLKEGSRYEEEGLLKALADLYASLDSVKSPVHNLVMSLALFHLDGSKLQLLFKSTNQIFAKLVTNIWTMPTSNDVIADDVIGSTVNNLVKSFNARGQEFTNLSDLAIYIPPKIEDKARCGMYLYDNV